MGIEMDLRHLRYFVVVAEEGHITRAAERLNIQQPPLSRLIKAIEQELEVQLFRRKPRGVELTEAGRGFLDKARLALANVDQAIVTARRTARGEQGQLCVGVTTASAFHPSVPPVIRAFRETFPLVSLTLEESDSNELAQLVRNELADVVFIRSISAPAGLLINRLLDEELVVAIPSGHPLALRKSDCEAPLPLKMLAGESFIIQGRLSGHGLYASTIAACHAVGFSPKVGQEIPRITSALGYVAAGLGVSLIPASMQRMQMIGVSYRRLTAPPQLVLPLYLVSRRGDSSALVRQFLNFIRRSAKSFSAE
jgi:DNA-binding transcriptional LysR family regulator